MTAAPQRPAGLDHNGASDAMSDSDEGELFFDAAPGHKRAGGPGNGSTSSEDDERNGHATPPSTPPPFSSRSAARSSAFKPAPHKRMRTAEPAKPQGIKRAAPRKQAQQQATPIVIDIDSDSDVSFQRRTRAAKRHRPDVEPLKPTATTRPRTAATSKMQRQRAASIDDSEDIPVLSEKTSARKSSTKQSKRRQPSRTSNSFNFTPMVSQSEEQEDKVIARIQQLRALGNTYYKSGDYHSALAKYTHALEVYPHTPDVEPPIALYTNRAAAYISLGQWEEALRDMRQALSHPCSDVEGNVKRLARYLRCLLALAKVEGEEAEEAIKHAKDQLDLLSHAKKARSRTVTDAEKVLADFRSARVLLASIATAREQARWAEVGPLLDSLDRLHKPLSKSGAPHEWNQMRAEAYAWTGRVEEAKNVVDTWLETAPDHEAAALWFRGLFAYADGDIAHAVVKLEALRLAVRELPQQASRLMHRAYSIASFLKQAAANAAVGKWPKVVANLTEVLRIASSDQPVNTYIRDAAVLQRAAAYYELRNDLAMADLQTLLARAGAKQLPLQPLVHFRTLILRAKLLMRDPREHQKLLARADLVAALALTGVDRPEEKCEAKEMLDRLLKPKPQAKPRARPQPQPQVHQFRMDADPYEILGVARNASKAQVRKAYMTMCLQHHPDKPNGNEELFKKIVEAYNKLQGPTSRQYT